MYLENIDKPDDLKKLKLEELNVLAEEMRFNLIEKLSKSGGHIGPNLGVIELTLAMHYVFNSPIDKIVFDVSHQCYPHKMLTGRKAAFMNEKLYNTVTGFSNPQESVHDHFIIGHTSTAISLASGLAKARDLSNESYNVIAIVGDGSLGGGEALEGLSAAAELNSNLLIIVNDNDQSIAENHGGLYIGLKQLRDSKGRSSNNIFKAMGLDYYYLDEGHDLQKLIEMFNTVKDVKRAVVIHIHTIKGKGLKFAEEDRELWHAGGPFNKIDGSRKNAGATNTIVRDEIIKVLEANPQAIAMSASTPILMGFTSEYRTKYARQFVDVGICEEQLIAMASGIAAAGGTPVVNISSSFLQRTYDQLYSDLALNNNPAVILVSSGGIYGMNSNTHLGISDITFLTSIPNLVYLAPVNQEEYIQMFRYATEQKQHPIAIRIPANHVLKESGITDNTDYSDLNKFQLCQKGSEIAIIAVGNLFPLALRIVKDYFQQTGIKLTLINPKFISGLDTELLDSLVDQHKMIITIEDGVLVGGFGQNVASYLGMTKLLVKNYAIKKSFPNDYNPEELLKENGISVENIIADINKIVTVNKD
ncbi:MAG: 1-deoxy-D-xylulose-5-phosphate synthase [Erysipelotrichaceae bacterium]